MSATSGEGVTAKEEELEPHAAGAAARHAVSVNAAVWPLPRLRASSVSDGPDTAEAASCSGAPAAFSAVGAQVNA